MDRVIPEPVPLILEGNNLINDGESASVHSIENEQDHGDIEEGVPAFNNLMNQNDV